MEYLSFQGLPAANSTDELEAVVIQGGIDKRANGAALLAQVNRSSGVANIKNFGAKLDGVIALGAMNSGNATLTATSPIFTSTAVDSGKKVYVDGAGASGGPLLSSIASVTDSTHAVLANTASTTVSTKTVIFGTDDREAWMDAINYVIYMVGGTVVAPSGISIISDTILAGYGEAVHSLNLRGDGVCNIGEAPVNKVGTLIVAMFHDRPAIAVQGLVDSSISNLSILGLNYTYVYTNMAVGSADITTLDNWYNPQLTADSRYAPYCGIAIDAFCAGEPTPHYPTMNYDTDYYPSPTQYNKEGSLSLQLSNIQVFGFCVGIVLAPVGILGPPSGDYTLSMDQIKVGFCKWGISIARSERIQGPSSIYEAHFQYVGCAFVNNQHGNQDGQFGHDNASLKFDHCMEILQAVGAAGPATFSKLESSFLYIIGTWISGVYELTFEKFRLYFDYQGDEATPLAVFTSTSSVGIVNFRDGTLDFFTSVLSFSLAAPEHANFENVAVGDPNNSRGTAYERFASNFLCGGIVVADYGKVRGERHFKWRNINVDTAASYYTIMSPGNEYAQYTARPYCIPFYVDQVGNSAGNRNSSYPIMPCFTTIAKSSGTITAKTLTGLVLVLTLNQTAAQMMVGAPNATGLANGDVIMDDQTGTVWFVRSVTGSAGAYVVMADQQNNFKQSSEGAYTNPTSISLTTGNWVFFNSRVYTTTYAMFGTTSSGSGSITSAGRSDGNNSWMTTDLVNGDYVQIDVQMDNWIASAIAGVLSSVAAGSFTVGSNANVTAVKKRLPYFVRPGPANSIGTLTLSGSFASPAVHGVTYDHVVKITGGIPTYNTPTVASGSIPTGTALSIVGATLRLYGTNPTAGHYTGTVTVKDSQTSPATSNALAFDITIT